MSVEIIDTEGAEDSNSFCSLFEANSYLNKSFNSENWSFLDDDSKSRYIIKASEDVNGLNSLYLQADEDQGLKYPLRNEVSTTKILPIGKMLVSNPASLFEMTATYEDNIASVSAVKGSYFNPDTLTKPLDWDVVGLEYTKNPGAISSLVVVPIINTMEVGDIVDLNISLIDATAGSVEVKVGSESTDTKTIDADGQYDFTLVSEGIDGIYITATDDFNGTITINKADQTNDRYLSFATINPSLRFYEGSEYLMEFVEVIDPLEVLDGEEVVASVTEPVEFQKFMESTELTLKNSDFIDITFQFKISSISKKPSSIAARKATLKQTEHLLLYSDLLNQSTEDRIIGHTKEHGHHGYEKKITSLNPYSKYGDGVIGAMKDYISIRQMIRRM